MKTNFLLFIPIFLFTLVSCSDSDIIECNLPEIGIDDSTALIRRKYAAAEKVQKVVDSLYGNVSTRANNTHKTVNMSEIIIGSSSGTRATEPDKAVLFAIPFEDTGYSIVTIENNEIISIIPEGTITQKEVNKQIVLAQELITCEENLNELENHILLQKGIDLPSDSVDELSMIDLGTVIYNDLIDNQIGYTIWFDEDDNRTIYTIGYFDGISSKYVATYYVNIDGTIEHEVGEISIDETYELSLLLGAIEEDSTSVDFAAPITSEINLAISTEQDLNLGIYNAIKYTSQGNARDDLSKLEESEDVEVNLHTTTCAISSNVILSYGIKQSGYGTNWAKCFPNGHAGCGPVAIAACFMQQNVAPSKINPEFNGWGEFGYTQSVGNAIGYSYNYTAAGQKKFSKYLRNIASQCGAHYFKKGTAVSRNRMEKFLMKYFDGKAYNLKYKDSRLKEQIDRNFVEIVYGRNGRFIKGWLNQHYWVVTAYADIQYGTKKSILVYNNTSWNSSSEDGWYYISDKLGYDNHCRLFELGLSK